MAKERKAASPLTPEEGEKLYARIRSIESLEADKSDIQEEITEEKKLTTETLPIEKDVLDFVLKRRKASRGDPSVIESFDTMLEYVEDGIEKAEREHARKAQERIQRAGQRAKEAEEEWNRNENFS